MNMVNVAKGSGDAYVEYGLHIWDFAASGVILVEAGGAMIDPAGEVLLFTTSGGILKRLIVL